MHPAIRVTNLTKRFRLGTRVRGGLNLTERLASAVRPFRRRAAAADADFWALNDVSFEVQPGEVVGIIGRNGAGKSTLLKVLSRIVEPTAGRVELRGRVGSLLEVGTGFHPELTGRENIYLNGSVLGMTHREIARNFDAIVAFAGVDRFLDTPVKRYSSGMYVRLAFAVAAHLEPEILIVDEVLAVGDAAFQKKCLGKMGDVARAGRTVLLVSHNLPVIEQLAARSVLLEQGRVKAVGPTAEVVAAYQDSHSQHATSRYELTAWPRHSGTSRALQFVWASLVDRPTRTVPADAPLEFDIGVVANDSGPPFRVSFTVFQLNGSPVGSVFGPTLPAPERGATRTYRVTLAGHRLAPGTYYLDMALGRGTNETGMEDFDIVQNILHFQVMNPEGEDNVVAAWAPSWGSVRFATPGVVAL